MHTIVRRPWNEARILYLVGPGGVGKSTLGQALAPLMGRSLIDLDAQFGARIGHIGRFLQAHGNDRYKRENARLAHELSQETAEPAILVTSSGFLAPDNPAEVLAANHRLIVTGYSLSLLPALDVDEAAPIVVDRQLGRGFGLDRAREDRVFRTRFAPYRAAGDMLVVSASPPARAVLDALSAAAAIPPTS